MLEIPITAKIIPVLLAGALLVISPMPVQSVDYYNGYYEVVEQIGDIDVIVYINKKGEYDGWQIVDISGKTPTRWWFRKEQTDHKTTPAEQKIIDKWKDKCANSDVIKELKQKTTTTTVQKEGTKTEIVDGQPVQVAYQEKVTIVKKEDIPDYSKIASFKNRLIDGTVKLINRMR